MTRIASRCMEGVPYCFLKVIRQSLRSYGSENRRIGSDLGKITRAAAAIKSLRFAVLFPSIFLVAFDLMNAFPGGSLALDFLCRAISCWHGSGNFSLKEDSSTKCLLKHSLYLVLPHGFGSPNNESYTNLHYSAVLRDLLILICALLLYGWIPECMNWISPCSGNTWNVPTINNFLCNMLGRQMTSLWASVVMQFDYHNS